MNIQVFPFCMGEKHLEEEIEMELTDSVYPSESKYEFTQHRFKCTICNQQIVLRVSP